MRLIFSILLPIFLFAYYGKVEPFETYIIKSDVMGKVVDSNLSLEGKEVDNNLILKIDSFKDRKDLSNLLLQKENFTNEIAITKQNIKSQTEIVAKKKEIYNKYKKLKSKSQTEKDIKYFDYLNSKVQLNQSKIALNNLQINLSNIETNIAKLKDTISKKEVRAKGYLYSILVKKGDFVANGTPLLKVMDISKVKIYVYIPINSSIKNKTIYINGKKSNFIIEKVYRVADEKFVTSYKVEIVGNYPKISDIVKVEFK